MNTIYRINVEAQEAKRISARDARVIMLALRAWQFWWRIVDSLADRIAIARNRRK